MKVLIVSHSDAHGGACKAAFRLHRAMLLYGVDSKMLVAKKYSRDPSVIGPKSNVGNMWSDIRLYMSWPLQCLSKLENANLHSYNFFPSGLHKIINSLDVDVVNLHWVNKEMISISEIAKIRHPIVWTLHDMWPFSGAEHYDFLNSPGRYKTGYHRKTKIGGVIDLDRWVWKKKVKKWAGREIQFVSPSNWLAECVNESFLFEGCNPDVIPNCLDLNKFRPIDKSVAKKILQLDNSKTTILFGALSSMSERRKGYLELEEAIVILGERIENFELVILGAERAQAEKKLKVPMRFLGTFHDEISMILAYSAADLFVAPSLQENLANTVMEAMACGTPCVAFDTGGFKDLISHHEDGALAECFSVNSLAREMQWVMENNLGDKLGREARSSVLHKYNQETVVNKYLKVYCKTLH